MQESFPAGSAQHITIADLADTLQIRGWDQQTIEVTTKGEIGLMQPEGTTLQIRGCNEPLFLRVPYETTISVSDAKNTISIEGVHSVEIENAADNVEIRTIQGTVKLNNIKNDVRLENIQETITLGQIYGDLFIQHAADIQVEADIYGNLDLTDMKRAEFHVAHNNVRVRNLEYASFQHVGNNLKAYDIGTLNCGHIGNDCRVEGKRESVLTLGNIGSDLNASEISQLHVNTVGSDCQIKNSPQAEITIGTVGSDLNIPGGAAKITVGQIGSDCLLRNIQRDIQIGRIGSDLSLYKAEGNVQIDAIGSDANLREIAGALSVGSIGSDLHLQGTFPASSISHLQVGSDATIILSQEPDLTIRASVGGDIVGQTGTSNHIGNYTTLVYGNGSAQLELNVRGDLRLRSDKAPRSSSSNSEAWWSDFTREMADFSNDMQQLSYNLGEEISTTVQNATSIHNVAFYTDDYDVYSKKAEEKRRKAEERQRKVQDKIANLHVRINDREWRMNPERVNRIVEQARRAAAEGVQGAMEAVEQALSNLNIPSTGRPPSPMAQSQQAMEERAQPEIPVAPAPRDPKHIEQEREAILRMIAEGRISPEEGDLLLEALG